MPKNIFGNPSGTGGSGGGTTVNNVNDVNVASATLDSSHQVVLNFDDGSTHTVTGSLRGTDGTHGEDGQDGFDYSGTILNNTIDTINESLWDVFNEDSVNTITWPIISGSKNIYFSDPDGTISGKRPFLVTKSAIINPNYCAVVFHLETSNTVNHRLDVRFYKDKPTAWNDHNTVGQNTKTYGVSMTVNSTQNKYLRYYDAGAATLTVQNVNFPNNAAWPKFNGISASEPHWRRILVISGIIHFQTAFNESGPWTNGHTVTEFAVDPGSYYLALVEVNGTTVANSTSNNKWMCSHLKVHGPELTDSIVAGSTQLVTGGAIHTATANCPKVLYHKKRELSSNILVPYSATVQQLNGLNWDLTLKGPEHADGLTAVRLRGSIRLSHVGSDDVELRQFNFLINDGTAQIHRTTCFFKTVGSSNSSVQKLTKEFDVVYNPYLSGTASAQSYSVSIRFGVTRSTDESQVGTRATVNIEAGSVIIGEIITIPNANLDGSSDWSVAGTFN